MPRSQALLSPATMLASRTSRLALAVTAGTLAAVVAGPVAGFVALVYGMLMILTVRGRLVRRDVRARRAALLDQLATAAADLRAGRPATEALPAGTGDDQVPVRDAGELATRVRAAVALADRTGAPLADLLERIELDARAADRARAAAAAQSAGSQVTAWLLAALPVGGMALGYAIGADPLAVLLDTPLGAACVAGAVGLQLAGLAWTRRLARAGGAS